MVIDQQRRLGGTRSHPEVCPRRGRRHPPARGSRHHTNAHKEGFYHRRNGFSLLPHRHRERTKTNRATGKPLEQNGYHRAVEPIKADRVNVVKLKRRIDNLQIGPSTVHKSVVTHSTQKTVRNTRGASAPSRDFGNGIVLNVEWQPFCGAHEHLFELIRVVKLQVGGESEPVTQRVGQQTRAGSRTDESERCQLQRHGCRTRSFADHNVDPKILHRKVEHLLRGAGHPVNLINKQHLPGDKGTEDRGKVTRVLDSRTARHAQRPPPLVRDDHRERRLAEPGWTRQQNVIGSTLLQHSRREQQLQLPSHLCLPDELAESARAQRTLVVKLRLRCEGRVGGDGVASATAPAKPECEGPSSTRLARSRAATGIPSAPMPAATVARSIASAATFSGYPRPVSAASTLWEAWEARGG